MAAGPVATSLTTGALDASSTPSWGLEPVCAAQTQGLVVSPFADLASGEALYLRLPAGCGGAWLSSLRSAIPITAATGCVSPSAAIAFTWSGLQAMRLDDAALASFADPFRAGMQQIDRRRRLGDEGEAVVPNGVAWSGGTEGGVGKAPITVHVLLLLYDSTDAALDQLCATAQAVLEAQRVQIVRRTRLSLRLDANGISREHFGFADGVSQPLPYGPEIRCKDRSQAPKSAWHAVAPGDILLGHENAHGELAPGPVVKADAGTASPLAPSPTAEGFDDLGLNGSYLVVRELHQDVAAFWRSMDAAASLIGDAGLDAATFAARVIGRTQDGAPLTPSGSRPPSGGQPANDFGYIGPDPHGFGCPLGAHIRRANPRDGLAQDLKGGPGLLKAANNHRILRRGRKFGSDIADPRVDDGVERGLLFMCLNTDLVRQFEFVQQNWLLNPGFAVLFDETDPLLGPKGSFTLPGRPLRRRAEVETFVRFAGGDYFFLPSLPALDYLQTLK